MSSDFYLVSEKRRRAVRIASVGLGGMRFPGGWREAATTFLSDCMNDFADCRLVSEDEFYVIDDKLDIQVDPCPW